MGGAARAFWILAVAAVIGVIVRHLLHRYRESAIYRGSGEA